MKLPKLCLLAVVFSALLTACSGGGEATESTTTTETGIGTATTSDPGAASSTPTPTLIPEPTNGYGYVSNPAGGNYGLNCVKDYSTGLVWEGKSANPSLITYAERIFTNYDDTSSLQVRAGASTYRTPTSSEINAVTNTVGYKNAVNGFALCGFSDWRLPTKAELLTLVDTSVPSESGPPRINSTWFPNTSHLYFWTSEPSVTRSFYAWYVVFWNGMAVEGYRDSSNGHIRLVRSSR
jgi:hypothetical protein